MDKFRIEKTDFYHITHGDKRITLILEENKKEITLLYAEEPERNYRVTKRIIKL